MTPDNGLIKFPYYSADAVMSYGSLEEFEASYTQNFAEGFQPLQTYPAKFHNTVVKFLFQQAQQTYLLCSSIFKELSDTITESGQTLDGTDLTQLQKAIKKLSELQTATATVLGGVKSSALLKNVLVNADSTMTVNSLSDWEDTDGTVKSYVDNATTDLKQYIDDELAKIPTTGSNYLFFPDYAAIEPWITAWTDSNGYTVEKNGFMFVTLHTSTDDYRNYLSFRVNDQEVIRSNTAYANTSTDNGEANGEVAFVLPVMRGQVIQVLNVTSSGSSQATLYNITALSFNSTGVSMRFAPATVASDAGGLHAISATYLRPEDSDSVRVTADDKGNLVAHTLTLKTGSEFGDGKGD